MAARVRLAVIPSVDKALRNLGMFNFLVSQLLFAGRRHLSAATKFLCLVERLEELHTEVQGMISSPHLSTKILYYMSRRWIQYLNRCVAASASKVVEVPGASVPLFLEPILIGLDRGQYIGPILPISLAKLVAGRRSAGVSGSGGGGNKKHFPKVDTTGVPAQVWVRYEAHLPSLYLQDGENLQSILAGEVLPTLHSHVIFQNWHFCGCAGRRFVRLKLAPPHPPRGGKHHHRDT